MASFIITYDLNSSGQNYTALNDAIKSYGTWAKIATTTYIIVSQKSASNIRDYLNQFIDNNDVLFVAKLQGEAAWCGLNEEVSNWLKKNLEFIYS